MGSKGLRQYRQEPAEP